MPVQIDPDAARRVLSAAVARAQSDSELPARWVYATIAIGQAASKTYVAAFGTALLAKATDSQIDPMSIKATPTAPRAYSARMLCHSVLVPASREHGFDLGATGREPLNNQPFFRYERIDEMDRVRDKVGLDRLLSALREVDGLSSTKAADALAGYVRVRLQEAASKQRVDLRGLRLGVADAVSAAGDFIAADPEGGKRGQALVAAAFDLAFESVRMGRVNDPSRRFPGDVQVLVGAHVVLAAEARQKLVSKDDMARFARSAHDGGVANAVMVALHPDQPPLDRAEILRTAERDDGVCMTVIDSVSELLTRVLMFSGRSIDEVLAEFPQRFGDRLDEIEARPHSIAEWKRRAGG